MQDVSTSEIEQLKRINRNRELSLTSSEEIRAVLGKQRGHTIPKK